MEPMAKAAMNLLNVVVLPCWPAGRMGIGWASKKGLADSMPQPSVLSLTIGYPTDVASCEVGPHDCPEPRSVARIIILANNKIQMI